MTKHSIAYRMAIRHYLDQVWEHKKFALPGLLFPGIGSTLVFYAPPYIISLIIERFSNQVFTLTDVLPYIITLGLLWLLGEVFWRIAFLCLNQADSRGMMNLYTNALSELLKKEPAFFQENFAGSLTKKLLGYGRNFETFVDTVAFNILTSLIPFIAVMVVLSAISPLLSVTLLVFLILVMLYIFPLIRKRKKLVDQREAASNVMAGHVADVISNVNTVHAFAREQAELKKHEQNVSEYLRIAVKGWDFHTIRIDSVLSPAYVAINIVGLVLAIIAGGSSAQIATIFLTFSYYGTATRTLWDFNRIYRNLENALSDAAQFTELLIEPARIQDSSSPVNVSISQGDIRFSQVYFSYQDKTNNLDLFSNLNLHIKAGEKIALVGPSGGGKSTITKLLLRFADITSGTIEIDGHHISDIKIPTLRNAISYVPQDPQMFHRSIEENIRYGKPDADMHQVKTAARQAHADEFIKTLHDGYRTLVGERGTKLSGGQRQRIAIARALLKDAPILVLDEATSALDSESEAYIQDALWKLMEKRTALVIAHRLSTIQKMDRILVLDDGKIVEEGTHKELIARSNGLYAKLWQHQSGGFLKD